MSIYTSWDVPVFKSLPQKFTSSVNSDKYATIEPINIQQIINLEPYKNLDTEKDSCILSFLLIIFLCFCLFLLIYSFSFFEIK